VIPGSTTTASTTATIEVVVAGRRDAADGVVELTLAAARGGPLPAWSPGAHIDLRLADGLVRQYSLCGDPADAGRWRVAVLRERAGRGGSVYVHEQLGCGAALAVSAPRNNFELLPADRYLFVAGGIGITPLLPMIARAEAAGTAWTLLYGGRTRVSMAYLDELAQYGEKVLPRPQDEWGLLDLVGHLGAAEPGALVYACGPEPMLDAVAKAAAHWPPESVRCERFTPVDAGEPVRAAGFEVVLARSGLTVSVPPGCSILEAVEKAGVDVLSSCREGTCGTCETDVLDGAPEHRDSLLTKEERASGESMFICVSRSLGPRLTLDL
jgi:ferredoxin-NADP reductase